MNQFVTVYKLSDLAVFDVTGADAVSFMQGQITNDIAGAAPTRSRLAGYCTPQGRLLATMVLHHAAPLSDGTPVLRGLIKRDILTPVLKRLSMFVMRAKAKLTENMSIVRGVSISQGNLTKLQALADSQLPVGVWEIIESSAGTWISAPATDKYRWWLISTEAQNTIAEALFADATMHQPQQWYASDIAEGLPWIEAATQDLFIPQTLNLDLIEGVSFTKGCYPGQEIVARSHYRGTLKRRMFSATLREQESQSKTLETDATVSKFLVPGIDIYDSSREDQVCGRIINIAQTVTETQLLIESSFEALDNNKLHANSPDGPELILQKLPYSVRLEPNK